MSLDKKHNVPKHEASFHDFFEKNRSIMLLIEPTTGTIIDVNNAAVLFLGYSRDQLVGRSIELINRMSSKQLLEIRRKARNENQEIFEFPYQLASGEIREVEANLTPVDLGDQTALLSIVHDVTDRKRAERTLSLNEDRYRATFHASLDGISLSHIDTGVLIDVNPAFLAVFGYERDEVIGSSSWRLGDRDLGIWENSEDRATLVAQLRSAAICRNLQLRFRRKNGNLFWASVSAVTLEIHGEQCILFVIRDTTESRQAEQRITQLAFFDQLTGLPNRALFIDRLNVSLAHRAGDNRHSVLLYLDLNNFRSINETFGYQVGDALLNQITRVISSCVRSQDTFARLGGDDFAVLMSGIGESASDAAMKAEQVGQKIVAILAEAYRSGEILHEVSLSIGVNMFAGPNNVADTLLKQAEIAMYKSKEESSGHLKFFDTQMEALISARTTLEKDLREAIRQEQFLLQYQPQFFSGQLAGVEALIRWNHPRRGRVYPGEFIPFAEETRLMLPIGHWVLREACRQISRWSSHPVLSQVCVSVNISAEQFRRADFVDRVIATLAECGAEAGRLKLELTESMLVLNVEQVVDKMMALKAEGIGFSLDDFGTGYSSLAYLKRFPLDQLKIDQSFVRDMLESANDAVIARSIVSLGRSLGMCVVAEGVETEAQYAFLEEAGCHGFQGYLFGHPVSAEALESSGFKHCVSASLSRESSR